MTARPIDLQSEISDKKVVELAPRLVATMKEQIDLVLDQGLMGVEIQDEVMEHLAVAAARVALEVCPACWSSTITQQQDRCELCQPERE